MSSTALLSEASYTCPWRQSLLPQNAALLLCSEPALMRLISKALKQQLSAGLCCVLVIQHDYAEGSLLPGADIASKN